MAIEVTVKPLQGMQAFHFQVSDTVQVLELPREAQIVHVYNDTDDLPVYIQPNASTVTIPGAISGAIVQTPKILYKNHSPWHVELQMGNLAFVAPEGQTVNIRVEAYYQHGG